jgi:hypothetical protein
VAAATVAVAVALAVGPAAAEGDGALASFEQLAELDRGEAGGSECLVDQGIESCGGHGGLLGR